MIQRKYEWAVGLPVPGLRGIRLLHDTLYKDARPLKTQPNGCVVFHLEGEKNTRCVHIDTARYAVETGCDVFLTSTKQLARKAKKLTWRKSLRDHILWMQTVLMGVEQNSSDAIFEYLYSRYNDELIKVLDWHSSRSNTKRIEMAIWEAMKRLSELVTDGAHFVYAPAPYLIQCVRATLSQRTYY